ncbi:hypothetical protein ANN_22038 [Periplaneta americana]|uniref:Per a allergen n=1 Tax=Periplaneta americana TaxID=6978 RepID=A0ABQ8S704_PERAM|nr:hypothetical protein ANN_22038 [Periplaneta americana]
MAGLCEGGNEPTGSLKASNCLKIKGVSFMSHREIWLGGALAFIIQSGPCTVVLSSVWLKEEIPGRPTLQFQ